MRNIVSIDYTVSKTPNMVASTNDGSNTLYFSLTCGNELNKKLTVTVDGTVTQSKDVYSGTHLIEISELPNASANMIVRYSDELLSVEYKITFPDKKVGTLVIKKIGNYQFSAQWATCNGGVSDLISEIERIETQYLKIETAEIKYLKVNDAKIEYADIGLANIETASVGTLLAKVGLISSATIIDGHVTGYLDAVDINANKIKAGVLSVDRLVINGTEESIVYALNNSGKLESTHCDTLDGGLITERTITADHLVVGTITANEINMKKLVGDEIFVNAITTNEIVVAAGKTAETALTTAEDIEKNIYTTNKTTINGGKITTASITLSAINGESGVLTISTGHLIVNAKNFMLDSSGNATFSGKLSGATGYFTGNIFTQGEIVLYGGTYERGTGTFIPNNVQSKLTVYKKGQASATLKVGSNLQIDGFASCKETMYFGSEDLGADGYGAYIGSQGKGYFSSIECEGAIGNIGKFIDGTRLNGSIPNATTTNIAYLTLPKGVWVIMGKAFFQSNANGRRYIDIAGAAQVSVQAVNGAVTSITTTFILSVSTQTNVYLRAYQNSGTTLGLSDWDYRAVRCSN